MIKRQRASSSSLFLMELILAILLFCIAATICISVFARSHLMHKEAGELNYAINIVQNTAEAIRAETDENDIIKNLNTLYSSANIGNPLGNKITVYFDEEFNITDNAGYTYALDIEPENPEGLLCSIITFSKKSIENDEILLIPIYDLYIEHAVY